MINLCQQTDKIRRTYDHIYELNSNHLRTQVITSRLPSPCAYPTECKIETTHIDHLFVYL